MSKLLATSTDPYGKASDDKKVPEGNGIWSELLNNVSSGLPSSDANASFSHASNQVMTSLHSSLSENRKFFTTKCFTQNTI